MPKAKQQSKPTITPGIQVPIPKAMPWRRVVVEPPKPRPLKRPASDNIYLPQATARPRMILAKRKSEEISAPSTTPNIGAYVSQTMVKPTKTLSKKLNVSQTTSKATKRITRPKVQAPSPSRVSVAQAVLLLTGSFFACKNATPQIKRDSERARQLARERKKKLTKEKKRINEETRQTYRNYYPKLRA